VAAVSRRGWRSGGVLATGILLLALAWWRAPLASPPLYEGQPVAEPYRYLHAPPGLESRLPPNTGHVTLPLYGGQSPAVALGTEEAPSQAQVLAPANAFVAPAGAHSIDVDVAAVGPPAALPEGDQLDGNVYSITVTAGTIPLAIRPGQVVTVILRSPAGAQNPTMQLYAGGHWTTLTSRPLGLGGTGAESFAANVPMLGAVALVAAGQGGGGGSGSLPLLVALLVAALAIAGGVLLLIGSRRRRRSHEYEE
jgi:hypothetical protein